MKVLFYNMFVASPQDSIQDVLEINFGFEVLSVAGMIVSNNSDKDTQMNNENGKEEEK